MPATDSVHPVGVGVVGLGRAGAYHLERLSLRDDCRIVAAFDTSPAVSRKASAMARIVDDWGQMLDDDAIEMIVIATPPPTHAALSIEALAAGKHVLVETPLGLDVGEVDAIADSSLRANRSVVTAHTRRWDDDFRKACRCVRSGKLGALTTIKHVSWEFGPCDRRNPAPDADDWRRDPSRGGGALWQFGIHDFDQLLQLAGEAPARVTMDWLPGSGPAAYDGFLAIVQFPSGLIAQVERYRAAPVTLRTGWIVVGAGGSYAASTLFTVTPEDEVVDTPVESHLDEGDDFHSATMRHIRAAGPNPAPPDEARRAISLLRAAWSAARSPSAESVE